VPSPAPTARFILPIAYRTSYNYRAMPQSLSDILVHVIFSTKDRTPYLMDEHLPAMHAYLAKVTRSLGCDCYRVGGVADHVHLAIRLPRTLSAAKFVEEIKTPSSKWVKTEFPRLRDFAWQRGYGAFSIGRSDLDALIGYIDRQEEHHRTKTFQEEYLELLKELGLGYDPRYVWD
jgi:REP element-mobilizing transposase RayT